MPNRQIELVTDSSADIPEAILADLDISVVPLAINIGTDTYDETALSRDAFWDLAHTGPHPTTSQPSIGAFDRVYRAILDRGHDALCLTVTSKHSGTFSSAVTAAQTYAKHIHVTDSAMISMAHGLQVILAAKLAKAGDDMDTIRKSLADLRERTHFLIQIDTIDNLRRGGRASMLMPVIERVSRALHIKPILNVIDGELKLWAVVRSQKKGLAKMQEHIASLPNLEDLLVMHIRRPQLAQQFANRLAEVTGFDRSRILIGEAGAVLACHGGEGVIAVAGITSA